jgi:hypothetical protein
LALLTDGSDVIATETPTPVVAADGEIAPTATAVSTSCNEEYYCSKDPNQKGTLIHVLPDCNIELLPGNPQCAGDLGGGTVPTVAPGCGSCGDGGQFCFPGAICGGTLPNLLFNYDCTMLDGCGVTCAQQTCCGGPCW